MDTFSIEDILLEHELHKREEQQAEAAKEPQETEDVKTVADKFRDPKPKAEFKPPRAATEVFASPDPTAKRADGDKESDPPRAVKPTAEKKTVTLSTRTRVLTATASEEKYRTNEIPVPTQLDGQMVMDLFADEAVDEEALEKELRRRRHEKVSGFKIVEGGRAFKLSGEEDENDEEDPLTPVDEDEDELEDFNDYAEAEAVRSELRYRQRTGALALIATAGIEGLLIAMTLLLQFGWATAPVSVVAFSQLLLLLGIIGINHRIMFGGLKKLITFKASGDTPAAVCGTVGLLYTIWQLVMPQHERAEATLLFAAVAGLTLLAARLGRQMQIMRISRNFRFVSSEKVQKYAAAVLRDEKDAGELGCRVDEDGLPTVVYYRKASFVTKFLTRSYEADPVDKAMRWFMPLVLLVSALCAVGYRLIFPNETMQIPTVFTATVLVATPAWAVFSSQRATSRSCKRALKNGVMLSGYAAASPYGRQTDMVILEAGEVFRKQFVKLHGIKTFSGTRIDEAITDSAAVVIAAGGPLAPIFKRLIENRTDILREVDSLAYEQDMGLSGWVGGRRVLIGNRRLLANHGVDVPPKEYEDRYTKDGRKTVYLSTGGELSAMFVVSYLADPRLKPQLQALVKAGVNVAVRTCDANVTSSLMAQVMELPPRSVKVFTASEGRAYETIAARDSDTPADTTIACSPRADSKVFALLQCRRMRRGVWAGLVALLIVHVLAMLAAVFITVMTGLVLRADFMLALSLLCAVIGYITPRFFHA